MDFEEQLMIVQELKEQGLVSRHGPVLGPANFYPQPDAAHIAQVIKPISPCYPPPSPV